MAMSGGLTIFGACDLRQFRPFAVIPAQAGIQQHINRAAR
jgi:hypothetical protein